MQRSLERRAQERAEWLSRRIGQEIATARRAHGWSQAELARRIGTSQPVVSRIEAGWPGASVELLTSLTLSLGQELAARVYPSEHLVIRDQRHAAIIRFIVGARSPRWHPSLEVSVGADRNDRRAFDLVLASSVEVCAIEVERDIADLQAQLRGDLQKRDLLVAREARPVRLVLALPATRRLRRLVQDQGPLLSTVFAASSRRIWHCLRSGEPIGADGILWIPTAATRTAVHSLTG
jgi:transcriptional regulator with XRE-family HTH domain